MGMYSSGEDSDYCELCIVEEATLWQGATFVCYVNKKALPYHYTAFG
jgi:hypothetical protein